MESPKPSLNLLKPEQAFILKWLSAGELARLERRVLELSPHQYRLLKHGWKIGDGREEE
jgi:hypothetical protein